MFPEGGEVYMKTEKGHVRVGSAVAAKIAISDPEVLHRLTEAATIDMKLSDMDMQKLIDLCQVREQQNFPDVTHRRKNRNQFKPTVRDINRKANKQARIARRRNRK